MTNTILIGSYLDGVTLSALDTTISATGVVTNSVGNAVYGPGSINWTLVNFGSISDSGTTAGSGGVVLAAGGYVSNAGVGMISGYTGVDIAGQPGTVLNTGSIVGMGSTGLAAGVYLDAGGYVGNTGSGLITGYFGVRAYDAAGTVVNAGSISGGLDGIGLFVGGFVMNSTGAVITGYGGVVIGGGSGTVINAGSIGGYSGGVNLVSGGSVSNAASGVITGVQAVYVNGVDATVANDGIITSLSGDGVDLGSGGYVTNGATGTISGLTGVFDSGVAASVLNYGSIIGRSDSLQRAGVKLDSGGYVFNAGSASISGFSGVATGGGYGTVINDGSITATGTNGGYGVYLQAGGSIINAGAAAITGSTGVYAYRAGGTVVNSGTITGTASTVNHFGVDLAAGGSVSNASGGTIAGYSGVDVYLYAGAVANAGDITGTAGAHTYGVELEAGGTLSNAASGTITGNTGVYLYGSAGTVTNAGSIDGAGGIAVSFAGAGADLLAINPGAVFNGDVVALGTGNTLELVSAAAIGNISGVGTSFAGFGSMMVDAGATWVVSGSVVGSGRISLGAGSDLVLDGSVAATWPVDFTSGSGTLGLGDPAAFNAPILGLQPGDAIDFTSITSTGSIIAGVDGSNDLTLTSGGVLLTEVKLDAAQDFSGDFFQAAPDGGRGSVVTESTTPLCFLAGTLIATPNGDTPIERLAAGQMVLTACGEARPIAWLGMGRVLATRGRRTAATPVIVRKGALADNVPFRDLRLTGAHALAFDGVLIPVEFLVNHRSIHWDDMAQEVVLYHVELATHDVLLANGAPAESYRDDGNRWLFRNANSGWGLPAQQPCAPVVVDGPVVDAMWVRLLARAGARPGMPLTQEPDLHLLVDGRRIDGARGIGGFQVFRLPGTPDAVHIASRAAAPQELGLARDPRCLGVALRQIIVRQGSSARLIQADDPLLSDGFHTFEPADRVRWTDGGAVLPAVLFAGFDGPLEVVLQCAAAARYIDPGAVRCVA